MNAGFDLTGAFAETDLSKEMDMIRVDVLSVVHVAKHVVKVVVARRSGNILITSSIAGTMPTPYEAVYCATKAFDRSFAQSIREELKDSGVTVTRLMPGATEPNFSIEPKQTTPSLALAERTIRQRWRRMDLRP